MAARKQETKREEMSRTSDPTTLARIEEVLRLMRDCKFQRGKTWRVLAKKWNLNAVTTRRITAEASRRLRAELSESAEEIAAEWNANVVRLMAEAKKAGDLKTQLNVLRLIADVQIIQPARMKDNLGAMTKEELEAKLEQLQRQAGEVLAATAAKDAEASAPVDPERLQ
jgi:hypothetical protein